MPEDDVKCPERDCGIPFNSAEEVVAHLQWDHNRSEFKAERMVRKALGADVDSAVAEVPDVGEPERPDFPDDHPLAPYADDLQTHADHLDAYSGVLDDADPEEVEAAMLMLFTGDGTDTLPTVSEDVDPRMASLHMLGSFIHHVTTSANAAGGNATMEDVAGHAIHLAREHSTEEPVTDGGQDLDDPGPILDECPECGSDYLVTADEVNDSMWDDTDTACNDCRQVFDARGRFNGMFDSEVASQLHEACTGSLKQALAGDDDGE